MSQTQSSIFTAIAVQIISYIILNTSTPDSVLMDKSNIKKTIDKDVERVEYKPLTFLLT